MRKFINLISDKVVWCVDPIFILPNSLWAISHTEEKNKLSEEPKAKRVRKQSGLKPKEAWRLGQLQTNLSCTREKTLKKQLAYSQEEPPKAMSKSLANISCNAERTIHSELNGSYFLLFTLQVMSDTQT